MQRLTLHEDIFDKLFSGKTTTIRIGVRKIHPGKLLFQSSETHREQTVNVNNIYTCILKEVLAEDVLNDGFSDHDDMCEQMKRFYPKITSESEVTVVKFTRIENQMRT